MINSTEILALTRELAEKHGTDALYEYGCRELADANVLESVFNRAIEMDAEELADELADALDVDDRSEVLVEEIIEHVGNSELFKDFKLIAEDEDLQNYTPIYLLERFS